MGEGKPGNAPLEKTEPLSKPSKIRCVCCNMEYPYKDYYSSKSPLFHATGKIPYCDKCLTNMYEEYVRKYTVAEFNAPKRKAMERICMITDKYYNDNIFDIAVREKEKDSYKNFSFVKMYMKQTNMYQYAKEDYDTTIKDKHVFADENGIQLPDADMSDKTAEEREIIEKAVDIFGSGFTEDDYLYLYNEYSDWTARHECNTKAQEELFKRLCFKQLDILKAERRKENTDKLDATYQNLLQTANLQPRQNAGDTTSDNQTFGTLIDKWENTRPIPEADEEFKDVDGIKKYIDVFFRGHMAKMLGIDSGYADEYDDYMEQYTVNKPEYSDEDGEDAIYNSIFGEDE